MYAHTISIFIIKQSSYQHHLVHVYKLLCWYRLALKLTTSVFFFLFCFMSIMMEFFLSFLTSFQTSLFTFGPRIVTISELSFFNVRKNPLWSQPLPRVTDVEPYTCLFWPDLGPTVQGFILMSRFTSSSILRDVFLLIARFWFDVFRLK